MILPFKNQFVPKILDGSKIHSIRNDPHDRWQPDKLIHMATGVRTPDYYCFMETPCVSIQYLLIDTYHEAVSIEMLGKHTIRRTWLDKWNLQVLAENDGFDDIRYFFQFFRKHPPKNDLQKLIHWTKLTYPIEHELPM